MTNELIGVLENASLEVNVTITEAGPKGEKGDPFVYDDFTPTQLEGLKGPKGDPFVYDDFTPAQLEGLKGPKGDKGDDGHTPIKGTDYWTTADQTAIVSDVLAAVDELILGGAS
jgi:hypothetical protein